MDSKNYEQCGTVQNDVRGGGNCDLPLLFPGQHLSYVFHSIIKEQGTKQNVVSDEEIMAYSL